MLKKQCFNRKADIRILWNEVVVELVLPSTLIQHAGAGQECEVCRLQSLGSSDL